MDAKLTQDELRAIKERAEKATDGPWELSCVGISAVGTPRKDVLWATINEDIYGNKADVDFVLNARQDIPKLVAEVERLQSELDRLCALYNEQGTALSNRSHDIYKLRKTLEYYADSRIYQEWRDGYAGSRGTSVEILRDYGRRAGEALK